MFTLWIQIHTKSKKAHIESVHRGKTFSCPQSQCSFQTKHKSNVQKHIISLHECLKFSCTLCGHQATQKRNIQKHIKLVHRNNRMKNLPRWTQMLSTSSRFPKTKTSQNRGPKSSCMTQQNPENPPSPYDFVDEFQPITTFRAKTNSSAPQNIRTSE